MRIRELGRGKYSDCFKVLGAGGRAVACKLSYYQEATIRAFAAHAHHGDRDAARAAKEQDAVSVSAAMAEVARLMKALRVSPHFVRVHCEADVKNLPLRLKPLLPSRVPLLSHNQLKYSHVCIMELYSCNLTSFLTRYRVDERTLRALLFQVVYTLACLQSVFPGFRHNDLSSNNVLIKPCRAVRTSYTLHGTTFVTEAPFVAALADFDFTHVPGHEVLSNERVLGGKYGISQAPNDSYDVAMLLRSVRQCLKRSQQCPRAAAVLAALATAPPHAMVPRRLLAHDYFQPLAQRGRGTCAVAYALPDA